MKAKFSCTLALVAVLMGSCASYKPLPQDPLALAERQRDQRLDITQVIDQLARIAPGYAGDPNMWNSLTLFALALNTNQEIDAARAHVMTARASAHAAAIRPGFTLTLSTEYAQDPSATSPWLAGVAGDFLLDQGELRDSRIDAGAIAVRSAEYDYLATLWAVRMRLRSSFDTYLITGLQSALGAEQQQLHERQFAAATNRFDAGSLSRTELDRVRFSLSSDKLVATTIGAARISAGLELAGTLNVPVQSLGLEVLAQTMASVVEIPLLEPAQVITALQTRTEILQAMAAYDLAETQLRKAVAAQYPQFTLSPGYIWERGLSKFPLALGMLFSTADGGAAAISSAEVARQEAAASLEAAVAVVETSITRADAEYRSAWSRLKLVRETLLPEAIALARQTDNQLAAGAMDRNDWSSAQLLMLTARGDEIEAVRQVLVAEAGLETVLRQPLSGPETTILLPPAQ